MIDDASLIAVRNAILISFFLFMVCSVAIAIPAACEIIKSNQVNWEELK